jgi:hypothetical protein
LTSLRRREGVSLSVLVACASLTLCGLDGLMSGHVHVEDGTLLHHRHLFDGAHSHRELADHDEADHHEGGGHDDQELPGRSRGGTVSTLEIAKSLAASATASLIASELLVVALLDEPPRFDLPSRFSLTEGPRPPPGLYRS